MANQVVWVGSFGSAQPELLVRSEGEGTASGVLFPRGRNRGRADGVVLERRDQEIVPV